MSTLHESVAAIIFNDKKDGIYMIQRRDVPVWVFPGGRIDPGETPEQAVVREVAEETGFISTISRKVALYQKGGPFTRTTHFFECIPSDKTPYSQNETLDLRVFPIDSLPKLVPPNYLEWLDDALAHLDYTIEKKITSIRISTVLKAAITHPILFIRFLLARLGYPLS